MTSPQLPLEFCLSKPGLCLASSRRKSDEIWFFFLSPKFDSEVCRLMTLKP
ncbi:hypothetical protein SLEP1_g24615 [Rubroshorea leprosula]|uniref:Uncharacterized protein n=1 Tax=Rubroshorea leprosula TaxID=152421 RepID=A0AAV5JG89_9ROSI|nr:hypothetical protein SLEP1_g24615 [Rubroshorea leprosula]